MVFEKDSNGVVRKAGKSRPVYIPNEEYAKKMQERSDERLAEMIRGLDAREKEIARRVLEEEKKEHP